MTFQCNTPQNILNSGNHLLKVPYQFQPISGLQVLIVGRKRLDIQFSDSRLKTEGDKLLLFDSFSIIDSLNFGDLHDLFEMLWVDPGIKETFKRRSEIQVIDSIGYFLDNLARICKPDYSPSHQDILHARKTTQSIVEFKVDIENVEFHFTDVGGQVSVVCLIIPIWAPISR